METNCPYKTQNPNAPYDEWCAKHPNAIYPPCYSCKERKDKKYNSTTNKWE